MLGLFKMLGGLFEEIDSVSSNVHVPNIIVPNYFLSC